MGNWERCIISNRYSRYYMLFFVTEKINNDESIEPRRTVHITDIRDIGIQWHIPTQWQGSEPCSKMSFSNSRSVDNIYSADLSINPCIMKTLTDRKPCVLHCFSNQLCIHMYIYYTYRIPGGHYTCARSRRIPCT